MDPYARHILRRHRDRLYFTLRFTLRSIYPLWRKNRGVCFLGEKSGHGSVK
jgi:hypothetical protein